VLSVTVATVVPLTASGTSTAAVKLRTTPTIGRQLAELKGPNTVADDSFGYPVAISGTTAIVAEADHADRAGRVDVFTKTATGWIQNAELKGSDTVAFDGFGDSVAVSGSMAIVGANGHSNKAGRAYVFVKTVSGWKQTAELKASDSVADANFGVSVAISGTSAIVGANNHLGGGRAYVFTKTAGGWKQAAVLKGSDTVAGDEFGYSVAISGTSAIVGADFHGSAYVFTKTAGGWKQAAEFESSDSAPDMFGYSVAISGTSAIVGADFHGPAGSAYVFTKTAGGWKQTAELEAFDAVAGDAFGLSVAISGTTAIVSAVGRANNAGRVDVFTKTAGAWKRTAELKASDSAAGDAFGGSLAISGTTAIVGRYERAYVFTKTVSVWDQVAELEGSDTVADDGFGRSVAISGTTAIIGVTNYVNYPGRAYVFTKTASGWDQVAELDASDTVVGDDFGDSVAISGSTAIVGADEAAYRDAGRAYVFTRTALGWGQVAELEGSDTVAHDFFGGSVAISGTTAVVGAELHGFGGVGRAYVFTKTASGWEQVAELDASDTVDGFGTSVAISGTTIVVGADGGGGMGSGRAYVFTKTASGWKQTAELKASDAADFDSFGASVAISGTTVIVGANFSGIGPHNRAYVFTKTATSWNQVAELEGSDTVAKDDFGGSVAISGSTAVVGADGHAKAGRAYVFTKTTSGWKQAAELKGSDTVVGDDLGESVAISSTTAIVGAWSHAKNTGRAYVFEA
jgi:hypothetical protein